MAAARLSLTKAIREKAAENQKTTQKHGNSRSGPKEPDRESKRATVVAAKVVGASASSTKRAAKILKDGAAATKQALDKDKISLNKAATISKLPKSEQPAAVKAAIAPNKESAPPKSGTKSAQTIRLLMC